MYSIAKVIYSLNSAVHNLVKRLSALLVQKCIMFPIGE